MTIVTTAATSACSSNELDTYVANVGCSVPAQSISNVLSTDRFKVSDDSAQPLPLGPETSNYLCTVEDGDGHRIIFTADVGPADEAADKQDQFAKSQGSFRYAGGSGFANDGGGGWACGQVVIQVTTRGNPAHAKSSVAALVKEFADSAGCWKRTGSDKR